MKKMKKILLLLLFLFGIFFSVSGQEFDNRLIEKYSTEYLTKLSNEQPQLLEFLTFNLDNSYYIMDICEDTKYDVLYELDENKIRKDNPAIVDLENINIYNYDIELKLDRKVVYKIHNTNIALVFYSKNELVNNFKNK